MVKTSWECLKEQRSEEMKKGKENKEKVQER